MELSEILSTLTPILIAVSSTIIYLYLKGMEQRRRRDELRRFRFERWMGLRREEIEREEKRKSAILTGPRVFYYLDETVVNSLYNQIGPSIRTTEIETEALKGISKGIETDLIIRPFYKKKGVEKEKKKLEVIETPELRYDTLLRYLLDRDLVKLGTEEFYYDRRTETEFLGTCGLIESRFNYKIPENVKEEFIKANQRKHFDAKFEELKSVSGYILMRGDFKVIPIDNKEWKLSYYHPANKVRDPATTKELTIVVTCAVDYMEEIGKDAFNRVEKINVKVFGNVINFDETTGILSVRPIAIH